MSGFDVVEDTGNVEYDCLPEAIKRAYPLMEWLWLSAREKNTLEQRETEPEC
jgi:hypothetical protein